MRISKFFVTETRSECQSELMTQTHTHWYAPGMRIAERLSSCWLAVRWTQDHWISGGGEAAIVFRARWISAWRPSALKISHAQSRQRDIISVARRRNKPPLLVALSWPDESLQKCMNRIYRTICGSKTIQASRSQLPVPAPFPVLLAGSHWATSGPHKWHLQIFTDTDAFTNN